MAAAGAACSADDASTWLSEGDDDPAARERPLEGQVAPKTGAALVVTANSGAAYVAECRNAGVPVPDTVIDIDNGWEFISDPPIEHLFMATDLVDARLWVFRDDDGEDQDGICMALPRGTEAGEAEVVGMICMGSNGMTCFFTNRANEFFPKTVAIGIDKLAGGMELVGAPEGVCSDCHAGENPFIIHPEDEAFATVLNIRPEAWPTPIVPHPFPGNPEPLAQLGAVDDGERRCDGCHAKDGQGGRFPFVSSEYDEYCEFVLTPALAPYPDGTMPPQGTPEDPNDPPQYGDVADYDDHATWLAETCGVAANTGVVVPFNVPPSMAVRPPDVDPPYECTRHVRVSNAVYGATLKLYIGAAALPSATGVFRDPEAGFVFALPNDLPVGTLVSVNQKVGAITSTKTVVSVRKLVDDFPNGLPAPVISPAPIYECARAFAVMNVPGAELTAVKTPPTGTASTYTVRSGSSHSWISGLGSSAFVAGSTFKVRQKICNVESDWSTIEVAAEAPATLPEMTLDPVPTVGQPIVYFGGIVQGAGVTLSETNGNVVAYSSVSVPYTAWRADITGPLAGPVQANDDLEPTQTLCGVSSGDPDIPPPQPCNEETIVPRIAAPFAGDRFVLVTYAVPGSTVRVFDGATVELGNGAAHTIDLSRALVAGEVLMVSASLPGPPACSVNRAFSIVVQG